MIERDRPGRAFFLRALAATAFLAAAPAMAQKYPDKPITVVHNYGPGTASDATARMIGEALSQQLGKSVVIDNRAGAAGVVGTKSVTGSAPDGYTLMIGPMTAITTQPHLVRDVGLSPDLIAPICNISANILGAAVRSDGPFTDAPSIVAEARKRPLDFGSTGPNSLSSLAVHKMKVSAGGGEYVSIPYRSDGASLADLLGGRLDFASLLVANGTPMFRAGTLRLIGVFAEQRHPEYPNVPTFREQGIDAVQMSYAGMIAPKGTPEPILDLLEANCKTAIDSAPFKRAVEQYGIVVDYRGRKAFAKLLADEYASLGKILKELGVQPQ
jgi:tripartite-type tricarboxylate transporter receptor subunit TctC